MPSLFAQKSPFANDATQLEALNSSSESLKKLTRFGELLKGASLFPLKPTHIEIFQVNIGKMCNQVCKHCHVDAGPDRKEIMTQETMQQCLDALDRCDAKVVDITGGAPEMNPHFRWFVEEVRRRGRIVLDRCNLTIIYANPSYNDLPEFFAKHKVHVVASLPYYDKKNTDRQRGDGVFEKSIQALKKLNSIGYGKDNPDLQLDLVYNPVGAFLPGAQKELENDFKRELLSLFGIQFNALYAITNMPISRFLEYLVESGNLDDYMEKLVNAFNAQAAAGVMCRSMISIGWDGVLYDCDFNQMLGITVQGQKKESVHIKNVDWKALAQRSIAINQHCFGCTAGAGSSCTGTLG